MSKWRDFEHRAIVVRGKDIIAMNVFCRVTAQGVDFQYLNDQQEQTTTRWEGRFPLGTLRVGDQVIVTAKDGSSLGVNNAEMIVLQMQPNPGGKSGGVDSVILEQQRFIREQLVAIDGQQVFIDGEPMKVRS